MSQTPKFLGLANSYLVWRISICQENQLSHWLRLL
uniref:Uncharacterized protein n=1 Tax=Trichinella nativa TaxID=6335 RepID=A0A0V1JR37_9BILA